MNGTPGLTPNTRLERRVARIARRAIRRERRRDNNTLIIALIIIGGCGWLAFFLWAVTPG